MTIVFYVSGHGFGHAARDIEISNSLTRRRPDLEVRFRTAAPRWLFDVAATGRVTVDPFEADTGVAQIDSLRIDEEATVRRAAHFYADFDTRAEAEASWLRASGARLVVGDIPPIAFAAAARADLPSIAIGNFTWDWIYAAYDGFARQVPDVIATIREADSRASLALRLPFSGGFEEMRTRDIPLVARRSRRPPEETRRGLGIPGTRPLVLASFGGYGAALPVEQVGAGGAVTVVETRVGRVEPRERNAAGVIRFGEHELYDRGFRYEDLIAAADVVVTKPGYGIVSECIANGTALVYTSRGRFVEYDVFAAEMPRFLRCRYLPQEDLRAGRWADAIEAVLRQPAPPLPPVDGADAAADQIIRLLGDGR